MRIVRTTLVVASLLAASVASGQVAQSADAPVLEARADEAIVYFVRPRRFGGGMNFWAFIDDRLVGVTRARKYVAATVPAGERVIWSRSGNVSAIRMRLQAGETYYFEQEARSGAVRARVRLTPMDAAEAQQALSKCSYRELTAEGIERGAEILASDYEEALQAAGE